MTFPTIDEQPTTAPITYFYQPFLETFDLEAFDPKLREELGVWYMPPELVRCQVRRVNHILNVGRHPLEGGVEDVFWGTKPDAGQASSPWLSACFKARCDSIWSEGRQMPASGWNGTPRDQLWRFRWPSR
jgi:hypothetical protein